MTARTTVISILAGLVVLAAAAAGVIAYRGDDGAVIRGVALGAGLGAAGLALEAVLVSRALALPKGEALRVVIAGFGIRLAVLGTGVLLLRDGGWADPTAFALLFVSGFLAGLPAMAAASVPACANREVRS